METSTIKTNSTEQLILSTLQAGEKNGLEIVKSFKHQKHSIDRLYPILHNLIKKGLVQSRWVAQKPQQKLGDRKLYYRLTELGLKNHRQNLTGHTPSS